MAGCTHPRFYFSSRSALSADLYLGFMQCSPSTQNYPQHTLATDGISSSTVPFIQNSLAIPMFLIYFFFSSYISQKERSIHLSILPNFCPAQFLLSITHYSDLLLYYLTVWSAFKSNLYERCTSKVLLLIRMNVSYFYELQL